MRLSHQRDSNIRTDKYCYIKREPQNFQKINLDIPRNGLKLGKPTQQQQTFIIRLKSIAE